MRPLALYKKLHSRFGEQFWWPVTDKGSSKPSYKPRKCLTEQQKFEICLGAILTQNTDWKNAMKALENLNKAKMLSSKKISKATRGTIAKLIKPSGYFNQKAERVKKFCQCIEKGYDGSLNKLLSKPIEELRSELLSLQGIGNETADDIILYAAELPSFVVDAYTMRFVKRFYQKQKTGYVEVKVFFESQLPRNAQLFNEFHALLVEFGKRFCKKRPNCSECFLKRECLAFNSKKDFF